MFKVCVCLSVCFVCLFIVYLFVCLFVCSFCFFVCLFVCSFCLFVLFYPVSWLEDSRSAIVVELLLRERFSVSRNINFLKKKFLRTVNVKVRLRWLKAILVSSFEPWLGAQLKEAGSYLTRSSKLKKKAWQYWTAVGQAFSYYSNFLSFRCRAVANPFLCYCRSLFGY